MRKICRTNERLRKKAKRKYQSLRNGGIDTKHNKIIFCENLFLDFDDNEEKANIFYYHQHD